MPAYTCIARVHMERMCARNSIEGRHKSRGRVKKKFSRLREKKRKRKEGKEEKRKERVERRGFPSVQRDSRSQLLERKKRP